MAEILVVDDEAAIADLVEVCLKNEGYTVYKCGSGEAALACVARQHLDLAILDVMLPDLDGFTLCQKIREEHLFPILMLTARVEDMDKIMGLTLGADDYITKPFNPLELVARVKTQLRRYTRYNTGEAAEPRETAEHDFRGLQISRTTHKCVLFGEELALTPLEFAILWVAISYSFIARPMRLVDTLAAAAEQLAQPGEEPIELPESMEDLEGQLNAVRERALRDARAAREAEQRKNDLVVYLAHDLKTPLTSVIGYLTLLRDEPQISPELRSRYTGIALEKAERLEDLINEFFDITRFSLTHLELEKQPTDLTRMLEQVASEFAPQFAEKDLRCELELPPRLAYDCDPDKLARVFDNLLRNAFHYSFPGSTVRIAGRREEDAVVLTFTNEGRTIPAEKLERIFDQFFRLDSSRATRTGGAGLGLAIAKEILALHGGTIRAASADNRITFTVRLPLQEAAARNS